MILVSHEANGSWQRPPLSEIRRSYAGCRPPLKLAAVDAHPSVERRTMAGEYRAHGRSSRSRGRTPTWASPIGLQKPHRLATYGATLPVCLTRGQPTRDVPMTSVTETLRGNEDASLVEAPAGVPASGDGARDTLRSTSQSVARGPSGAGCRLRPGPYLSRCPRRTRCQRTRKKLVDTADACGQRTGGALAHAVSRETPVCPLVCRPWLSAGGPNTSHEREDSSPSGSVVATGFDQHPRRQNEDVRPRSSVRDFTAPLVSSTPFRSNVVHS